MIIDRINHFDRNEYVGPKFNPERADKVCRFIECLTVPSGEGAGKPFVLRPWQKRFIYDVYAPVDPATRRRLVRRAILSIARKNGKTALLAALVLVHLIGPESETNGEIYSAANSRDQASIVFKFVAQYVRADPELDSMLRVVDSTKTIGCPRNGSVYKALAADANRTHGLSPSVVIYDELAQAKNKEFYDALTTSMGGRTEPLFIVISTQSHDPKHVLSKMIDVAMNGDDPMTVCHLYEVPLDTDDIYNEDVWYLANPGLGDFRSLEDMRVLARQAKAMPSEEAVFRNLFLNQRVSAESSLVSRAAWTVLGTDSRTIDPGESVYAGLDLSSVNDLSSLVLVSAEDGDRVLPFFWKPVETLEEHSDRDFGKGNHHYKYWHADGYLETTPGATIQFNHIAARIVELSTEFDILGLAFDRYKMDQLILQMEHLDFVVQRGKGDGLRLEEFGQGFVSMGPAVDYMERSILEGTLLHPNNPVLTWNMANAIAVHDPAGNKKLDKSKARFRIDGAVAMVMAMGLKSKDYIGDNGPSVYEKENRGLFVF